MNDNYIMVIAGLALIIASVLTQGVSYGMAPHRQKPVYPATRRLRIVLFLFGLAFAGFGVLGIMHK